MATEPSPTRSDTGLLSREDLVAGCTVTPGLPYLRWLTRILAERLDASLVFVGELIGEKWDQVRCVAAHPGSDDSDSMEYPVRGTPCANVLKGEICCYPRGVAELFPDDELLAGMDVEGYVGIPLRDSTGRPIGILVSVSREPIQNEVEILAALAALAERTSSELARIHYTRQIEEILRTALEPSPGDRIRALTRLLGRTMQTRWAFVAERVDGSEGLARTITLLREGEAIPNVEYPIRGTPCEPMYDGDAFLVYHAEGMAEHFPDDEFLQKHRIESYMGIVLRDLDQNIVGHLGLFDDRPLPYRLESSAILHVIAGFVTAELQRRRAEEERIAYERQSLEKQRIESLGLLAGGIAHDFNNLLVGILGSASLGLRLASENDPIRSVLEQIEGAAERASDLARQLLAYSGKGQLELQRIDLSRIVEEMSQLVQVSVPKEVEVRYDLTAPLAAVEADATQIRQVILNLVLNATEAIGSAPGEVTLRTGVLELTSASSRDFAVGGDLPEGRYAFLEVTDTGCGMDEETRTRIFDPFFTTKFMGRGLGLAAVQGIVQGHRGALRIRSRKGRGTTFTLLLPCLAEAAAPAPPPRSEADDPWTGGGTALVVDDEPSVCEVVGRMLEALDFEVLTAVDGRDAMRLVERHGDDLRVVLLDLTMPVLNGEDTLEEIHRLRPELKVLLMSGYNEQEAKRRDTTRERAGFLRKPFKLDELQKLLKQTLPARS